MSLSADALEARFEQMCVGGLDELEAEHVSRADIVVTRSLDCRYTGQSFALNVPWSRPEAVVAAFESAHEQRYGHRVDKPVEVLNLRVKLEGPANSFEIADVSETGVLDPDYANVEGFDTPVACHHRASLYAGARFDGPALLIEQYSTALVHAGWQARTDSAGNVLLERSETARVY